MSNPLQFNEINTSLQDYNTRIGKAKTKWGQSRYILVLEKEGEHIDASVKEVTGINRIRNFIFGNFSRNKIYKLLNGRMGIVCSKHSKQIATLQ